MGIRIRNPHPNLRWNKTEEKEGKEARLVGIYANPYREGSSKWKAYNLGWNRQAMAEYMR